MYPKQNRKEEVRGWGGYPVVTAEVFRPERTADLVDFLTHTDGEPLARGGGSTYGDASVNEDGVNIDMSRLNKMLEFCSKTGELRCEAGVTLEAIIETFLPRGFFLHVTPGTQFATVAGCIACDAHGKNWAAGSFGHYVKRLKVMLRDGRIIECDEKNHPDLFFASLGGMGLTGVILEAILQLKSVSSSYLNVEKMQVNNLRELFDIMTQSMESYEYLFSWVDAHKEGAELGRGIVTRANHISEDVLDYKKKERLRIPLNCPSLSVNRISVAAFNHIYYRTAAYQGSRRIYLSNVFYPLDCLSQWYRIYGKRGFVEYQVALPADVAYEVINELLKKIAETKLAAHVAAIKPLSKAKGILSFPIDGITLAVDFGCNTRVWELLDRLDRVVIDGGGRVYLGKDARLSRESFSEMYSESIREWDRVIPKYRVNGKFSSRMSKRILSA